jgi:putative N6-adenine-specific DNA methylase
MCGSGTFLIESAMRAMNIAPGLLRDFAAEKWGLIPESIWKDERELAGSEINRNADFRAIGSDIDPAVLEIAAANAKRAGVDGCISFERRDIKDFAPQNGIVICNPPYGERLLEDADAQRLLRDMGKVMREKPGIKCYIIGPEEFEKAFGRKADRRRKLYNGMIQCHLYMYFK